MSDSAERQLIDLVSREQRGLRRVLIAGITTLVLVVAMSGALGYYYSYKARELSETSRRLTEDSARLDRHAFDMRRAIDAQTNRVSAQEAAIRRAYDEIRQSYVGGTIAPSQADVLAAVSTFLQRGRHSISDERLIELQAASEAAEADADAALVKGAASLLAWQRGGGTISRNAVDLPDALKAARDAFAIAATDPAYRALGETGLAWILFLDASSERSAYAADKCEAVNAAVSRIASDSELTLQPLYWRAQCSRKMGRTVAALRDYSLALQKIAPVRGEKPDADEITLQMNAYHGLGTVLINTAGLPDDPEVNAARALAEQMCIADANGEGSALMKLTRACLAEAIALRRQIGQTPNLLSGSAENISFTYLRDGDFEATLENATIVEKTGLFAWNELIRALAAEKTGDTRAAKEARRNVSMFEHNQFAPCELQALMTPEVYAEAVRILSEEHAGKEIGCRAT